MNLLLGCSNDGKISLRLISFLSIPLCSSYTSQSKKVLHNWVPRYQPNLWVLHRRSFHLVPGNQTSWIYPLRSCSMFSVYMIYTIYLTFYIYVSYWSSLSAPRLLGKKKVLYILITSVTKMVHIMMTFLSLYESSISIFLCVFLMTTCSYTLHTPLSWAKLHWFSLP